MSLFARLVSRNYRRGLAAEARGQLAQAAEAFARAGRSRDVVRVRRQLATRAEDPAQRARALREVLILGEGVLDAETLRGLRAEAARALIRVEGDREAHGEAATLFEQAGDHLGAADALLSLGRYEQARRALTHGRHFERLEQIDRAEADRRHTTHQSSEALATAKADHQAGERDRALRAIEALDRASPAQQRDEAQRLRAEIEGARTGPRMALAAIGVGQRVTCIADLPAILGRTEDSPLPLRDPGVSRQHARVIHDGAFRLEDLESRNGTFLAGIPIAGSMELDTPGYFTLGERCRIGFEPVLPGAVVLTVDRGLAAGARAALMDGPVELSALIEGAPSGARLSFDRGWFVVVAAVDTALNGQQVETGARIQLLVGDRIALGELVIEVRRN